MLNNKARVELARAVETAQGLAGHVAVSSE